MRVVCDMMETQQTNEGNKMTRYITTTYGVAAAIMVTGMSATYAICTGDLRAAAAVTITAWAIALIIISTRPATEKEN